MSIILFKVKDDDGQQIHINRELTSAEESYLNSIAPFGADGDGEDGDFRAWLNFGPCSEATELAIDAFLNSLT